MRAEKAASWRRSGVRGLGESLLDPSGEGNVDEEWLVLAEEWEWWWGSNRNGEKGRGERGGRRERRERELVRGV